jgi:hypothetical protein
LSFLMNASIPIWKRLQLGSPIWTSINSYRIGACVNSFLHSLDFFLDLPRSLSRRFGSGGFLDFLRDLLQEVKKVPGPPALSKPTQFHAHFTFSCHQRESYQTNYHKNSRRDNKKIK